MVLRDLDLLLQSNIKGICYVRFYKKERKKERKRNRNECCDKKESETIKI
jgi:hypothetical protein